MTVELLPLDPLDWFVVAVNVVKAEIMEGEVNCALAAASTCL